MLMFCCGNKMNTWRTILFSVALILLAGGVVLGTFTPPPIACADHCNSCKTYGERTCDIDGCASDYIFNEKALTPYNNWCIPCPASCGGAANCLDLQSTDGVCGTCPYESGGPGCQYCNDWYCLLCPDDPNVCTECLSTYGLNDAFKCVPGDPGGTCGIYGQYVTMCTECLNVTEYSPFRDGSGACGACGPNCLSTPNPSSGCQVSGGGLCDTCEPPYVANSSYVCVIPPTTVITTPNTATTKTSTKARTSTTVSTTVKTKTTSKISFTTEKTSPKSSTTTTTTTTVTTVSRTQCNMAMSGSVAGYVPRCMWNTDEPNMVFKRARMVPVPAVIVHHTFTEYCKSIKTCSRVVRDLEIRQQRLTGVIDIAYNFLIGGDGNVYIGRGWDVVGQYIDNPTYAVWLQKSTGIAFIGDFNVVTPTKLAVAAFHKLVARGITYGHISPTYTLYAHYDIECTQCPGPALRYTVKTWARYRRTAPVYCAPLTRTWYHPM